MISILATVCIVLANKKVLSFSEDPLLGTMLVPLHTLCTLLVTRGTGPVDIVIPVVWLLLDASVSMISLFGSLLVLKYASVSFQQVGRLLTLPVSAVVDRYFWGVQDFNCYKAGCIIGIIFGFILVCSDLANATSLVGVLCNLVAVIGQVGSQTVVKLISAKFQVTAKDHFQQAAPYSFACSLLPPFLGLFVTGKLHLLLAAFRVQKTVGFSGEVVGYVLLSCALGVLIQFLSTWLGQISSAVAYALLTLLKSACVIAAGAYAFSEPFGTRMSAGIAISLTMFYGYLRSDGVEVHNQQKRSGMISQRLETCWKTRQLSGFWKLYLFLGALFVFLYTSTIRKFAPAWEIV